MNCRDAREQLDAARPGPDDRKGAEFAAAMQHVAGCTVCRDVVRGREQFDRKLGRVMRDVSVPVGLKSRILDSLQSAVPAAETLDPREVPEGSSARRLRTRRWLLAAAGTVAVALLAALAVRFWPASQQPEALLTLSDLRQRATLSVSGLQDLEPFDGSFAAKPPGGIWEQHGIRIDRRAKGDLPDENGNHRVALFGFDVPARDGLHRGVLLVIPKDRLDDPPSRTMPVFEDRAENYARRASGTYHSFAWQSDGFVYVCFVPKDSLRALQQVVSGRNA